MGEHEFHKLKEHLQEMETNPDLTLFLMDYAKEDMPYIKVPLGDNPFFDGFLILYHDGWFIDYEKEK
jgi:hypothetical protein